jgi:hypothetical protein
MLPTRRRWRRLAVSLLLTSLLCVPAAVLLRPRVLLWRRMTDLASPQPARQRSGLAYVQRNLDQDPRLWPALIRDLPRLGDETFLRVVLVLVERNRWSRQAIPDASWQRWIDLEVSDLTSPDQGRRALAAQYLRGYGPADPRWTRHIVAALAHADDDRFQTLAGALLDAGLWSRPAIPPHDWLRQVRTQTQSASPPVRLDGVYQLADLTDAPAAPEALALLATLLGDNDADVRAAALGVVAELAGACPEGPARREYLALLTRAAADPDPPIARRAWVLLGLLHAAGAAQASQTARLPAVAQAALWARLQSNPTDPAPALAALEDPAAGLGVRAMAVYALHDNPSAAAVAALLRACGEGASDSRADIPASLLLWRAVLSLPDSALTQLPPDLQLPPDALAAGDADVAPSTAPAGELVIAHPVLLARLYRLWAHQPDPARALAAAPANSLRTLAAIEGLPPDRYFVPIPQHAPAALQLAALEVTVNPEPAQLALLMQSGEAAVRDRSCVLAAERLTRDQCDRLVAAMLLSRNDNARRSAAILVGLTGVQLDLLARVAQADLDLLRDDPERWPTAQVLELGLWMQGRMAPAPKQQWDQQIETLAQRPDLPRSTFLLGMLYKDRRAALDLLLTPRGEAHPDLIRWLDQWRWRRVLYHFLPADAPPFWVWADPDLERFQIEVLRDWYLLHRYELGHSATAPAATQSAARPAAQPTQK